MSPIDPTLVPAAVARPVAWALIHFLWQGTLVALFLAAALRLGRRVGPGARHGMAVGSLLLMALCPIATGLFLVRGEAATPPPASHSWGTVGSASASPGAAEGVDFVAATTAAAFDPEALLPWVFAAWSLGVVLLSLYQAGGWWVVRRLGRIGVEPLPAPWRQRFHGLVEQVGLRSRVRVLASSRVAVPTVIGWLRPAVLVPLAALHGLSPQALEALVLHELAHVRRHDPLVNALQSVVETLLFYHPGVWWVSRQIRVERENVCDDLAAAACGSRRLYARALAEMEGLRSAPPRLALAADGGNLLARIRRLAGRESTAHEMPIRWLAGSATLALVAGLLVVGFGRAEAASRPLLPGRVSFATEEEGSSEQRSFEGRWQAEREGGSLWIEIRREDEEGHHRSSFTLPLAELSGFGDGVEGFELRRDAGALVFDRELDGDEGSGRFAFRAASDYPGRLRELGFASPEDEDEAFALALFDVSIGFLSELRQLGYAGLDLEQAIAFRIHGVTPDLVRELESLGYGRIDADRLVELRIHGISPQYIREMSPPGELLPLDDLVSFRIHGVSRELVDELDTLGYGRLDSERLVELRIHGVDPEDIRAMNRLGFRDLDRLVSFRIHGITPEWIEEMVERWGPLDADELVSARIQGVSAEYAEEMKALGYAAKLDDLVSMRIHGVTPESVRELRSQGIEPADVDELIAMRIHGVSPDYVREMAAAGYPDLDVETLVELRIHGIDARYVERLEREGLKGLSVEELVRIKIHGFDELLARRRSD